MPPTLALALFDLLAERRRDALHRGWPSVPDPVFCSETGKPIKHADWLKLQKKRA